MKSIFRSLFAVVCLIVLTGSSKAQWVQTNGPYGCNVSCFATSGNWLFAGSFDGGGVFLSTNSGASWTAIDSGLTNTDVYTLAVFSDSAVGSNLFAGTDGGVFLSTKNGSKWGAVNSGLKDTTVYSLMCYPNGSGGTNLYAGTGNGVFISTNNGTSWSAADSGLTTNTAILSLTIAPNGSGGTSLFAGTDSGVFRSTNSGATWLPADSGLPANTIVLCFAVSPNGAGDTNIYAGTDNGVFFSTNSGTSWTQFNAGLTNTLIYSLAVYGKVIFVGTYGGVFYFANDWYVSRGKLISKGWVGLNNGWGAIPSVLSLTVSGNNILAAICGLGVWLRPLSDVVDAVRGNGDNAPLQFSLSQNYPNPFNPSTTINYQLPMSSQVTLKIYDVLGREMITLVNGRENAGAHAATFDGSRLSSGIYFYRLQVGNYSETRKLMLLK